MRQISFRLCIMLMALAMLPLTAESKKKQFGHFIFYDGKLNNEGKPEGKGKLETVYGSIDMLKGIFDNGKVDDAELVFCKAEKKYPLALFGGTLEYEVAMDGSRVTYKLLNGILTVHSEMFRIVEENPLVITRLPSANECMLQYEGYLTRVTEVENVGQEEIRELEQLITKPFPIRRLLKGKFYKKMTRYGLDDNFTPIVKQNCHSLIDFENTRVSREGNRVYLIHSKDYSVCYEYGSGYVLGFKKKLKEGTIDFDGSPCMDFTSNSKEKGLATFENFPEMNCDFISFTLRNASSVKDLGINVLMGQDAIAMKSKLQIEGLQDMIFNAIKDKNATFSKEEELTNRLLAMEKSPERTKALESVWNQLKKAGSWEVEYTPYAFYWHKGTERGKQELALAERIKKRMNDEGNKTFGFLPGQKEGDVVVYFDGNDVLSGGTVLKKNNGVLTVDDRGEMTFKMNDGTVFKGYFKEQVKFLGDSSQFSSYFEEKADLKLLQYEELTPWSGSITYADGTTDELTAGESVKAMKKAEQEKEKAAYDTLCKKFGKKYTDDAMAGRITIGMPEALLISAFKTKLIEQNASSKLYRIYGWGVTDYGSSATISNNAHTKSVWVTNGKVSSVRNWQ